MKNPFARFISKAIKKFKTGAKTPQEVSQVLFASILNYRHYYPLHGGLDVDEKTWRRLKAVRKYTWRMRALNACHRTNGGKS